MTTIHNFRHERYVPPSYSMLSEGKRARIDQLGICACLPCRAAPRKGVPGKSTTAWACWNEEWYRTEAWRVLSWYVGDQAADWLCTWCDRQPEPKGAVAALHSAAALWGGADDVWANTGSVLASLLALVLSLDATSSRAQAPTTSSPDDKDKSTAPEPTEREHIVVRPFEADTHEPNRGTGRLPPEAETEVICPACRGRGMLKAQAAGELREVMLRGAAPADPPKADP